MMKAWRASHILPFWGNCAQRLLCAELVAELVVAVVGVHDYCSLLYPSSKRCQANCVGLDSCGVRRQVKYSPFARCDPEVPPDEVGLTRPSEDA